jgi:HKD family nuclease
VGRAMAFRIFLFIGGGEERISIVGIHFSDYINIALPTTYQKLNCIENVDIKFSAHGTFLE